MEKQGMNTEGAWRVVVAAEEEEAGIWRSVVWPHRSLSPREEFLRVNAGRGRTTHYYLLPPIRRRLTPRDVLLTCS